MDGPSLREGRTLSCGCLWRELTLKRRTKHGHATRGKSPEYLSWRRMKTRCLNPRSTDYRYWGGRGITVCERWLTFENFLVDMGAKPKGTSLDRINNDGHYEPGNCRWATPREQCLNRRKWGAAHATTHNPEPLHHSAS